MVLEDKYIGLLLAITSSLAIGASYVITKVGLKDAAERNGFVGDGHEYLKNPIWWLGMMTMVLGEIANFAAYAFAPAILVTPLGALSVLAGAVLGSYFLKEELGKVGKLGCAICVIGSVIIASHAPPDKEIQTVDEILNYAIKPGFLIYCIFTAVFSAIMIYRIAPKYGKTNPLYYLSICAMTGSVSVMSIKAFGIALKLTFAGNNQFTHPSTYAFAIVTIVCIMTQMNYFNKALNQFAQTIVSPVYYVTFTTAVLTASFILFQGFNTTSAVNTISLLCGFLIIFSGVYLLNLSRADPNGERLRNPGDGLPTDAVATVLSARHSMQSSRRSRSFDHRRSMSNGSLYSPRPGNDREGLLSRHNDVESQQFGLTDLAEDSDEDTGANKEAIQLKKMNGNGHSGNGKSPR